MLKKLLEKGRYSFHEGFENWEDAVKAACAPILNEGVIMPEYVDAIISNVKEYGPYIVIAPDICIPHAKEEQYVKDTAICFMKTNKPVQFDKDDTSKDARLFFVLASIDNDVHLNNLSELVTMLSDEEKLNMLLNSENASDLEKLVL